MIDLATTLMDISGLGRDMLWRGFLVFARVGAAMALLPAFGEQTVPQRVRLSLAFAFTLIVAPAAGEMPPQETSFVGNLFAETVVGLALGAAVRLYILALQTAGAIAANATSLAQLFGGAGPEPQPAISNLLVMAALAVAVAAGLHVQIAQALVISYDAFPAGQLPASGEMAKWGVAQISSAFSMGFTLAAPFTIAAFLYNLALGVINRAMPSLMVSFIGAPALAGGGLILVALVSPAILIIWSQSFSAFLAMPFGAAP